MRTLYLVSKRLPRVCMGGSQPHDYPYNEIMSAPRVHGWFRFPQILGLLQTIRRGMCIVLPEE